VNNRVVITGLGILAANGNGTEEFWSTVEAGRSGIGPITLFDAAGFPVRIAGEVKNFDLARYAETPYKTKRLGRHTQLGIAACYMALRDAGLSVSELRRISPVVVAMGVSTSAIDVIERGKDALSAGGPTRVSPYIVSGCQPHAIASALTESLGITSTSITISTACAAGLDAIHAAATLIRAGKADVAIAGGADSPINPLTVASFGATGMVPTDIEEPALASRPFDINRRGGIMAEGAGVLVLESLHRALGRGVRPYLELGGYGSCADRSDEDPGTGLSTAMFAALANAGCLPEEVDAIFAHGPSDPLIDRVETAMIKRVLGRHAYTIPVTSIKGVTGNPLSAAGPLQIAACALGMRRGLVPPTANHETPDPACDLDYVPRRPRHARCRRALVNVHGLGGGNSALLLERYEAA
jgi:3-oxoacyl-[acyl-carrier-protein] synthase II